MTIAVGIEGGVVGLVAIGTGITYEVNKYT